MALMKLTDYYPDHRTLSAEMGFDLDDLKNFSVYAQNDDKVGSVHDVLVDDHDGRFRYFIVDTGSWIFGKKVLVPMGLARLDAASQRIYINSLTKQQVQDLPAFDDLDKIDFEHEEEVRGVYRPTTSSTTSSTTGATAASTYDRNTYNYDQDAALYNMSDRDHQSLRLYEERLIANKQRQKTGEVAIGKHVETETATVSVPLEKERVIVERTTPTERVVAPGEAAFQNEEMIRMDIYEETPEIHKEAFVREEVKVKKVVEQETATAKETLRREELDLNTPPNTRIDHDR